MGLQSRKRRHGETVDRYFEFFTEWLSDKHEYKLENGERVELELAIKKLRVIQMRCLMTGNAQEDIGGYNCSYIKIDNQRSFDEILYVLMNGTGVGFSVEEEYTNQLPVIQMSYMILTLQL